jgi:Tfp pilus assembly protein PilO
MKLDPKMELGVSAGALMVGLVGWYFALYSPVVTKSTELKIQTESQEDSLDAMRQYKINTAKLIVQNAALDSQIAAWDARFPARTEIVELAKQILAFGDAHNLDLIEMRPSLFELYALEKAGAHVSGRYMMQLPISCQFRGRYLDLGLMLEKIGQLPFNVTIADVGLTRSPTHYPLLDIKLRLFLYVHL